MKVLVGVLVLVTLGCHAACESVGMCYSAADIEQSEYTRCSELVKDKLWVAWKIAGDSIEMAISRAGAGWVAIGVGEESSGSMKGADIIVVSKIRDVIAVEDRFSQDFAEPVKDTQQNVELLSTGMKNGRFQAVVRRPLLTCDLQDNAIRDGYGHMLLYAFGADGDWTFKYHGTDSRGVVQIVFTGDDDGLQEYYAAVEKTNPDHVIIKFNNYHIPITDRPSTGGQMVEGSNQYKCLAVPLHNVTHLSPPFDIIAGNPMTSKYLHHFVNSACELDPRPNPSLPFGQDESNDIYNCGMGGTTAAKCSTIPGWAAGTPKFAFGPEQGVRISAATKWFVFDTHYYNPTLNPSVYDSSGFDYIVTSQLRPSSLAYLWTGIDVSMKIPKGQKRANYVQHCPAEAIEKIFSPGQDSIQLLRAVQHLHQRGNGAFTYIVRDGRRIPVAMQANYDYNFQGGVAFNGVLKRGDAIQVHCTFDTSLDTSDIMWGERTQDEMCISILQFTPPPPESSDFRCVSTYQANFGHIGIMMQKASSGDRPVYRYNQTKANLESSPAPDSTGSYDLPWAEPLDPTFKDYAYKVGNTMHCPKSVAVSSTSSSPSMVTEGSSNPGDGSSSSGAKSWRLLIVPFAVAQFLCVMYSKEL